MKKLLFMMLIGLGGTMLVKNGHVTITPDNEVRVAGYAVPLPAAVRNSPVMGLVTTMLMGQLPAPPQATVAASGPGVTGRPAMPMITSGNNTYNANTSANAPKNGLVTGADGFAAAAKALRGSQ